MKEIKRKVGGMKYLPVLLILLSITIMIGSTFAYFTDREEGTSDLTFSKVELSSETTIGIDGKLRDVIPGSKLVDGAVAFSKSIDSEAIYVRAKISFSLPREFAMDNDMQALIKQLRKATDFNIINTEQHGAVWSAKDGNYFYLLSSADNTKLMRVETIDTFALANEVVVPRDLTSLPNNAQYMKSINFHIAFEAIQADNVSDVLSETKTTFDTLFPIVEDERYIPEYTITYMGADKTSVYKVDLLQENDLVIAPAAPENATERAVFEGWYLEAECINKFEFGSVVTQDLTLYPNFVIGNVLNVMDRNGIVIDSIIVRDGEVTAEPEYIVPKDEDGSDTELFMGWYLDDTFTNEFTFGTTINENYTLYPLVYDVSQNLSYSQTTSSGQIIGYKVSDGSCTDTTIVVPKIYKGAPVTAINSSGFSGNTALKEVILPDSVTALSTYAFTGCSALEYVNLSDEITSIPDRAFYNCSSLKIDTIPSSVTTIGESAFYNCSSMEVSELPQNLITIKDYAFNKCASIGIDTLPESVTSLGLHVFTESSISQNNEILYLEIGDSDKYFVIESVNKDITSVTWQGNVSRIHSYAFDGCANLVLTSLPNEVELIGDFAFNGCSKVALTSLPSGLEKLGNNAFMDSGLTGTIVIPSSITSIGINPFAGNGDLTLSMTPNSTYKVENNCLIDIANKKIISGFNTSTIGDDILIIGQYAFYNCDKITSITIPEGMKTIENYAFYNLLELNEIKYNATSLNDLPYENHYNFYDAGKNTDGIDVTFGANVKNLPSCLFRPYTYNDSYAPKIVTADFEDNSECTYFSSYVFDYCKYLESVTIPSKIVNIGSYCFYGCKNLKTINYNATAIRDFNTIMSLSHTITLFGNVGMNTDGTTVNIGANVTRIPGYIFCAKQSSVVDRNITKVVFADGSVCSEIGQYAFYYNKNLKEVELPSSLTTVGQYAFESCSGITKVNFNTTNMADMTYNYAFANAGDKNGSILTIDADVTRVPGYVFSSADFTSIVFEDGSQCSEIGANAFSSLSELISVTLPDSVTSLGKSAFYGCGKLENITMTNSITTIGESAFESCKALTSITIPENVTSIGNRAFYYCEKLTEINFNAKNMSNLVEGNGVFAYAGKSGAGVVVTVGNKVTQIPDYMFAPNYSASYSPKIVEIVFEETSVCASIGTCAFQYTKSLKKATIPESVTIMGSSAFSNCTGTIIVNTDFSGVASNQSVSMILFNSSLLLCKTDSVARMLNRNYAKNPYSLDTTTDFTGITFEVVDDGTYVNGTYTNGTSTWVRVGTEGDYNYYKKIA